MALIVKYLSMTILWLYAKFKMHISPKYFPYLPVQICTIKHIKPITPNLETTVAIVVVFLINLTSTSMITSMLSLYSEYARVTDYSAFYLNTNVGLSWIPVLGTSMGFTPKKYYYYYSRSVWHKKVMHIHES